MESVTSKLTSKYQATIPAAVRERLGLKAGDSVAFELVDDGIRVSKAQPVDEEWTRFVLSGLSEWDSPEDEEAYRDL